MTMTLSVSIPTEMYNFIKQNHISPSKVLQNGLLNLHQHGNYAEKIERLSKKLDDAIAFICSNGHELKWMEYLKEREKDVLLTK